MGELKKATMVYKDEGSNQICEVDFAEGREPTFRGNKEYCEKILPSVKARMR